LWYKLRITKLDELIALAQTVAREAGAEQYNVVIVLHRDYENIGGLLGRRKKGLRYLITNSSR